MISFLPFAILGYILNAVATLIDKALLDKSIPDASTYTFYLGILSLAALGLVPFGFYFPSQESIFYSIISGVSFALGWLHLYIVLKKDEASRVSPIIGVLNPIFTLLIGSLFLSQVLNLSQLASFTILTTGLILISSTTWFTSKIERRSILLMVLSGLFFALSSVFFHQAAGSSNFITSLVISRVGMFLFVLLFLFLPKLRKKILYSRVTGHHLINPTSKLLIIGQIAGALGGLLLSYSISIANPAIVNAVQGVQYIVILLAVLLLGKRIQRLLDENLKPAVLGQKIIGAIVIFLGLILLGLSSLK